MVKIVLLELKIEVSEDMRAAIIQANIRPRAPGGNNSITILGYARFVQPAGLSQYFLHISGSTQAISS